jgi:aminodeoxyfutalosine deaminase
MSLSENINNSFIVAGSWLVSPGRDPIVGGAMLVRDGLICEVGTLSELKSGHSLPVADYPGCVLLPGFVNAHTHLELTHFPSWRLKAGMDYHPRRFVDWIIQLIKVKRALTVEDYRSSVHEGMRICLESGTTAIGEIVSNPAVAGCYAGLDLTGRLYFEVLGQDPVRFNAMLSRAQDAAKHDVPGNYLPGLSPHAPYTIADGHYPAIRAAGEADRLPFAIHLSESAEETEFVFSTAGQLAEVFYPHVSWDQYLMPPRKCSSTELLARSGMLRPGSMAIHCVHVSLADAEILKKHGVRIVLCPRSNERLSVGRAPVALFRKLAIPLALGTDSLASNDSLSIWDEIRFAHDVYQGVLSPADLFGMATVGGAEALGISDLTGSLEVGRRADFQVVQLNSHAVTAAGLLERVIGQGRPEEVYLAGVRYTGEWQ